MSEISSDLQASFDRASQALEKKWSREKTQRENVYLIDIPEQSIRVSGDTEAKYVLSLLKNVRIHGTYRVNKGGKPCR